MIQYDTRDWLGLLLRVRGTVVPRIVVRVAMVAAIATTIFLLRRQAS